MTLATISAPAITKAAVTAADPKGGRDEAFPPELAASPKTLWFGPLERINNRTSSLSSYLQAFANYLQAFANCSVGSAHAHSLRRR
jgi:hypothetical protein